LVSNENVFIKLPFWKILENEKISWYSHDAVKTLSTAVRAQTKNAQ